MSAYRIFWGEAHDNTYQVAATPCPIDEVLNRARSHLDFYAAAYYTACAEAFQAGGHLAESNRPHPLILEGWKDEARLAREWAEVQAATKAADQPGTFVTFPGYEWQGDGSSGDHNVFALTEGLPIFRVNSLAELYGCLRGHAAVAIPHHTAYRVGVRGHDWSVFDPELSPFAEIYSIHGCSETDEELIGLRQNSHLGPGVGGGTYQDALDRGYRLGAICSTDNWGDMPGHFGRGCMACLAEDLTRQSLWQAFKCRRVYGVTGDRVELDFQIDGAAMGSVIPCRGPRSILVRVRGADAIDRIELLRGSRVIATHCHQGTWEVPRSGRPSRFKLRVEAGWGPRPTELPVRERRWDGAIAVAGGRFLGVQPCWVTPGQVIPTLSGSEAHFRLHTTTATVQAPHQNANVFEFTADPAAVMAISLNGLEESGTVADFAARSREMWYRDECVRMLAREGAIAPGSPERQDIYHHVAFKAKLHRVIPEAGYVAELNVTDDEPVVRETHYRVRVEQRNGQRAWSSPIWVCP